MTIAALQERIEGMAKLTALEGVIETSEGRHLTAEFTITMEAKFTPAVVTSKIPGRSAGQALKLVPDHKTASAKINSSIEKLLDNSGFKEEVGGLLKTEPLEWVKVRELEELDESPNRELLHTIDDCEACGTKGKVQCDPCRGHGSHQCGNCGGTASVVCTHCRGYGVHVCHSCNGSCQRWNGQQYVSCPTCHGSGWGVRCGTCRGTKYHACQSCYDGRIQCHKCSGEGRVRCTPCNGHGAFTTTHQGKIRINRSLRYNAPDQDILDALTGYVDIATDRAFKPALQSFEQRDRGIAAKYTATLPVTMITVKDKTESNPKPYRIRAAGAAMVWIKPPKFLEDMLRFRAHYIHGMKDDQIKPMVDNLRKYELGKMIIDGATRGTKPTVFAFDKVLSAEFVESMSADLKAKLHRGVRKPVRDFWRGYVFWFGLAALGVSIAWPIWMTPNRHLASMPGGHIYTPENLIGGSMFVAAIMVALSIPFMNMLFGAMSRRWLSALTGSKATKSVPIDAGGKRAFVFAFLVASLAVSGAAVVPELITHSVTSVTAAER